MIKIWEQKLPKFVFTGIHKKMIGWSNSSEFLSKPCHSVNKKKKKKKEIILKK